jgi:hypothetical protein
MKIFLLYRHRYWTEYVDFLLDDQENFAIVRSKDADSERYRGISLPLFNPKFHRIVLTSGLMDDPTDGNLVIFRSQHSPGFYVMPQIVGYRGFCQYHPSSDFRMYLLDSHYRALMTREFNHPELDEIRYEMLMDPRVRQTPVDLSMYQIKEAIRVNDRVEGTGLICLRWLSQYVPVKKNIEVLKVLRKELKLTMVIHPCTNFSQWIQQIKDLEGSLLEKVYVNIPRSELIGLFDESEYIITDGSGSCYEGMIRGCKPLAIRDLYDGVNKRDSSMEMVYDQLEEEYFPFRSYRELKNYRDGEDNGFIQKMYPFLYEITKEEAKECVRQEVLSSAQEANF